MSQIIDELATIEVSNEAIRQLDLAGTYKSFRENYKKLDDFKKFRSEHEQRNAAMRWWHNDQLRDAQLTSVEVQGEFSKTIGQLMLISIMQSKKLAEQQGLLSAQQQRLTSLGDRIADHTGTVQARQHELAAKATELKNLFLENSRLHSMTENGMRRLIEIGQDVKAAQAALARQADDRAQALEAQCTSTTAQVHALETELRRHSAQHHAELAHLRQAVDGLEARLSAQARQSRRLAAGTCALAAAALPGVARLLGWF